MTAIPFHPEVAVLIIPLAAAGLLAVLPGTGGLTRVTELLAAGVSVACASGNIQDPFVPTGSGDMLEMARWTLLAGHLGSTGLGHAYAMATTMPAQLLGLGETYGIHEGARADLVITDAEDAEDLVASGPLDRAVFVGGQLVAGRVS